MQEETISILLIMNVYSVEEVIHLVNSGFVDEQTEKENDYFYSS